MGIRLERAKKRNIKLSLAYRLGHFLPLNPKSKLNFFLDLAWIFSRLAHEQTFRCHLNVPYDASQDFLLTKIGKGDKVLDIGCGRGYVIKRLIAKTTHIIGVDYDKASIDAAKLIFEGSSIKLIHDDIFNFLKNEPNAKFDAVVLSHVLEHINEPEMFLSRLVTVAKYFYIEVPDFEATHLNVYRNIIGTDLIYSDADHVSEFDRRELTDIINKAGLNILDMQFNFGVMRFWCQSEK